MHTILLKILNYLWAILFQICIVENNPTSSLYDQKNFNSFTPRSDQKGKPLYNIAMFSSKKMMVTFFFFKLMNFILWQDRKIFTVGFVWFNTKFSKLKLLEMKDREWKIYIQILGMKWFKPAVVFFLFCDLELKLKVHFHLWHKFSHPHHHKDQVLWEEHVHVSKFIY